MKNKKCNGCKEVKSVLLFNICSRAKNGFMPRCKSCQRKYEKEYRLKNIKLFKEKDKRSYLKNKDRAISGAKKYYYMNRENVLDKCKIYRDKNPEKIKLFMKTYYLKRVEVEPSYKLIKTYRGFIDRLVKEKTQSTSKYLGYTFDEFKTHLGGVPDETQAIDHKIPLSWFENGTPMNIIHNLDNLQILSREENNKKLNRFAHEVSYKYFLKAKQYVKIKYINKLKHYGINNKDAVA